jgi:OOP family OmpA-OmpF porin
VTPAQVEAHGIGYLAPIAPNTSPEGRERNRRVEVVLLSAGEP